MMTVMMTMKKMMATVVGRRVNSVRAWARCGGQYGWAGVGSGHVSCASVCGTRPAGESIPSQGANRGNTTAVRACVRACVRVHMRVHMEAEAEGVMCGKGKAQQRGRAGEGDRGTGRVEDGLDPGGLDLGKPA